MDLILCHTTVDFDALGAAVGLTRLRSGARIVLTGGAHPTVRDFLALHRDEYALIERRAVDPETIRSLFAVDTQHRDRLGKAAEWFDLPHLDEIVIFDHHDAPDCDIPATRVQIEPVGATTTLIAERLQERQIDLNAAEATVMALGIHVDTGSLTFGGATPRDAWALAWLMEQGANSSTIAEYLEPSLSPQLQDWLTVALEDLQTETLHGYTLGWVVLEGDRYVSGLSGLASQLIDLTDIDGLILGHRYFPKGDRSDTRLSLIGRSRIAQTDLNPLFRAIGGGGHARATSAVVRNADPNATVGDLVAQFKAQIPTAPVARELMSSPVRTIRPHTTIGEAHRILLRYGHSGLSVVDESDRLTGIVSRRDIDIALHHGFAHAPVKGYMSAHLKTITPDTSLPAIESLMVTYDIGRLPVIDDGDLIGIVTRTDVLRELHQDRTRNQRQRQPDALPPASCPWPSSVEQQLQQHLAPQLLDLLDRAAREAERRGWHLYLVGGAVRDVLLAERQSDAEESMLLTDIDLVVDGFHRAATVGAGVELAKALKPLYPGVRLDVHGQFQTAALLWHKHPEFDSLWVDIATARTEFYPYPAANPEVEASSIRQDLYRRDFTINALAVRLSAPRRDELLDFFGGWLDLLDGKIRVLHPNSFIEDPTRIYRAVRFAVRLGFEIEPQTRGYIRHALESGIYQRSRGENRRTPALQTRLKTELKYILQAPYWKPALRLLADLDALGCIHPALTFDDCLWWQVRLVDRWLRRFDPDGTLAHWQTLLEVLIAALDPPDRADVAKQLQLPEDSIERLDRLAARQREAIDSLPGCTRPSQVVRLLRQYELPSLILIAVASPRWVRRRIWQYLRRWSRVKPLLNGHDLKQLGYKPGPDYRSMLDDLLAATLDGTIGDRAEAETFVTQRYPRTPYEKSVR